jgi:very-short-patch-repair endonuclease
LLPGVYLHSATVLTVEVWRRAALLWAGTDSVLAFHSAGEVWRYDNVSDTKPEIVVRGDRHPRSPLVRVHRTIDLPDSEIHVVDGMRVTSPTRTVIDLASVLDASALRVAFESARRQRLTSVDKVRRQLDIIGGKGRPGAAKLESLLARLEGKAPSEFPLEVKTAEILERSDLPPFVTQYDVVIGGRAYRIDFAWPERKVGLECDGRLRHSEDTDFRRDRARWSDIASDGWRLLYATWHDTRAPARLVNRLQLALAP